MSFTIEATSTCPGCCAEACTTLECRVRGGTAELCGFDEYTGFTSTPPKFYLEEVFGGSIVICDYHSPDGKGPCEPDNCSSPVGAFVSESYFGSSACGGAPLQGNSIQAVVTSVAPTPGSPGSVRITLSADDVHLVPNVGTGRIFLNGGLVVSSINSGNSTASRDFVIGTTVTMLATVENTCVNVGTRDTVGPVVFEACIPVSTSTRYKYNGSATYFPVVNCDAIGLDSREVETISHDSGCEPPTTGGVIIAATTPFDPAFSAYVSPSPLNSATYKGEVSNDACATDRRATACDRFRQLQSEDTDEDAIDRLLASPGGAWSAWKPIGDGTGGTCIQLVCCRAAWEIRTYRNFEYKESQWRATIAGLTPGTEVDIFIGVYRRAYGVGTYALFQTIQETKTANMDGEATANGDVPNAEGFETFVGCTYRLATE